MNRSPASKIVAAAVLVASLALPQPVVGQCQRGSVAGTSIHYCIAGSGSPTIVLAAGAGLTSATWAELVPQLSELGTVVAFDRPGLGHSVPGNMPRSPQQISLELAALLVEISAPTPLVFVGHSMGGHHVVGAARSRLEETAAVILLDSPHPDFETKRLELLTLAERMERREALEAALERAPPIVADERSGAQRHPPVLISGALQDIPLTIVVADQQDFGPLGSQSAHRSLWISSAGDFRALSSEAELIVARGSGHMIHVDQPGLVVELVRAAAEAHRCTAC